MSDLAPVLKYAEYLAPTGHQIYTHAHFCGACRRKLGGAYGSTSAFEEFPEDLERQNVERGYSRRDPDQAHLYMAFCPWCGARFEDEWWRDQVVQNERPVDHYDGPGTHKGDVHEFVGAVEGHLLGTSSSDFVCWCEPEVAPDIMGCTIRHSVMPPPSMG